MLLHLANFLAQFQTAFQVFNYLTLRVILAALTALMLCLWLGPWVIRRLVEADWPGRSRRRPTVASFQSRYADHGRRHDPAGDCDQHLAVG